jgi:cytochrome b
MRVWDLPIRITHWLFVVCMAVSWWTAEQRLMSWHRYSGYTLLGLIIFRIYWGFAGSSTARFTSFVSGLSGVRRFLSLPRETRVAIAGHTPLGSWSVLVILSALLAQVSLGLFVTDVDGLESGPLSHLVSFDTSRALAEAHETMFDVLLALAALHVAAILFYLVYDRNNLTAAMLTGRKHSAADGSGMEPAPAWRLWTGLGLAALTVWLVIRG